jgi:signal recognition particle receptor subunit beta
MAIFDREPGKLVVRVVYDGPARAGKTTNLRQIVTMFTARRRSELVVPEERSGRTLWFDWIQVDGGIVSGYGLRCQIVTVPGQLVLRRRRSALLKSADAVVLVCDSTPAGLEKMRPAFGRVRKFVNEHAGQVPLVVQANKQDLPDAVSADEVGALLGADEQTPVVDARACDGVGVRETLVLAIRAAANRAQQLVLEHGIDALEGVPDDAATVLAELRQLDTQPDEVLDAILADQGFIETGPAENVELDAELVEHQPQPAPIVPLIPPPPPILATAIDSPPSPVTKIEEDWPAPPLAAETLPSGFIWPVVTGRELIRRLAARTPARSDSAPFTYELGDYRLSTTKAHQFTKVDEGRAELLRMARDHVTQGTDDANTVLVLAPDPSGNGHWIWTLAPAGEPR